MVKGDTATSIGRRYGISADELLKLNKIEDAKKMRLGQTLKVPAKKPTSPDCCFEARFRMHRKSVYCLVLAVAALIVIGCVMLFSTSPFALDKHSDPNFYIKRQFVWLGAGFDRLRLAHPIVDYRFWRRMAWPLYGALGGASAALFCAAYRAAAEWLLALDESRQSPLPAFRTRQAGSRLRAGSWFSRTKPIRASFWKGLLAPIAIAGGLMALIAPEMDMGTTALIWARRRLRSMFVAGHPAAFIAPLCALGLGGLLFVARHRSASATGGCSRFSIWRNSRKAQVCSSGRR